MGEQELIVEFVSHLGGLRGHPDLSVDGWPDKENRTEPEIDAIAGNFAIEHTSVDSVENQRQRNDWYRQAIEGLDQVIRDHVDCGLTISLDFDAIRKGMDWNGIRNDIQDWIVNRAPHLGNGSHEIVLPTSSSLESPIVMRVWKGPEPNIVGFSRFKPEDDSLPARIRKTLDRKARKLRKYQGPSYTTVVLVENDDVALMNEVKMLDALRRAYPDGLPQGVSEIWYADMSISHRPRFHDFTTMVQNEGNQSSPAR